MRREPDTSSLAPYVPLLARRWPARRAHGTIPGTLASVDLSGFTRLSERLAALGRAGSEELTSVVNAMFERLIALSDDVGGEVVSFGGDAILVLVRGTAHERRAASALARMQLEIARHGLVDSPRGRVRLRMSVGVHSGSFDVVRVGRGQRALLFVGPDVSRVIDLESAARAGQVLVSQATATGVPRGWVRRDRRTGEWALRVGVAASTPADAPAPPGMDVGTSARWLPPAVRRLLTRTPGIGELRWSAIAFVYVNGFDDRHRRDPAAARSALVDVFATVEAACARNGVTWLASDSAANSTKAILSSGVPEGTEEAGGRMLHTIHEIVDLCRGSPLEVRAGAAEGHVFAGDVGHPGRRTYTVMGDPVNTAARLGGRATAGEVLVGTGLVVGSDASFAVEELAPMTVKGKRTPVPVLRLLSPRPGRRSAVAGPLVGRAAERAVLVGAFEASRSGGGEVVEVVAASGAGKSHLLLDALRDASGLRVGRGGGDPYSQAVPYGAIAPALRALLGVPPDRPPTARELERAVGPRSALRPWLPLVAAAAGATLPETPATRRLDPTFRAGRLAEVVVEAVSGTPAVLVLDDVQWADAASIDLLAAFARQAARRAVSVVSLRRPEGRSLAGEVDATIVVDLRPLDAEAARALVLDALGDRPLSDHDLADLLDRAGGHPLFLRQLLAALEAGQREIPGDVERLTAARIDRLDPRDRRLLRELSVAGREAPLALVADAVADATVLDPARWRPLREFVSTPRGEEVRFTHDMYREVAYQGLPTRDRRALHERLAEAVSSRADPQDLAREAAVLATHYSLGGRPREAWTFARQAARRAGRAAAWAECEAMCRIALASAESGGFAGATSADSLRLTRAIALEHLGRLPDAVAALPRPRPEARFFPVEMRRARLLTRLGRFRSASAVITRSLGRDGAEGAGRDERAYALLRRAAIRHQQSRYAEALRFARKAAALADSTRLRGLVGLQLAATTSSLGLPESRDIARRTAPLLRRSGQLVALGNLLNNLGVDAMFSGRWGDSMAALEEASAAYAAAGDSTGVAVVANNLAEILAEQGRVAESRRHLTEARRVFRASGERWWLALTDSLLGTLAARDGDLEAAAGRLRAARGVLEELNSDMVIDADLRRAELLLRAGDPRGAAALAVEAVGDGAGGGAEGLYSRWAGRLGVWAMCQVGDLGAAAARSAELAAAARAADAPHELALVLMTIEGIEAAGGPAAATGIRRERARLAEALDLAVLPSLPILPGGGTWLPAP